MRKYFLFLLALTVVGCGGGDQPADTTPSPSAAPAPPPVDPNTAGTIAGKVSFDGEIPEQKSVQMAADPSCAKMHGSAVETEFVVANDDGTLRNVFVYVKEGLEGRKFTPPSEPMLLNQQGCLYTPHVFGIMTGQTLEILNSDDTLHNIHAMPKKNPQFNIGQPVKGLKTKKSFDMVEVMIPFKCDVHKWMNCYAGVLDHPYFYVTGDGGTFEIPTLPPGDYVIEAWHETFGAQTASVTVGEKETKEVDFTFTASE
jgi:hypothetical protein